VLRPQAAAGNYDEYFGMATDVEAVAYLMLCNQMLHDVFPGVTTIGEDVSGMPTFCRCAPAAGPPHDPASNPTRCNLPLHPRAQPHAGTRLCRRVASQKDSCAVCGITRPVVT